MNAAELKQELYAEDVKRCKGDCKQEKGISQFSPNKHTKDKHASRCKACMVKAVQKSKQNKSDREYDEQILLAKLAGKQVGVPV